MSLLVSIHFPLNSLHYFRLLSFSNILYLAAVRLFWSPWREGKINLNKLAAKVTNFGCYLQVSDAIVRFYTLPLDLGGYRSFQDTSIWLQRFCSIFDTIIQFLTLSSACSSFLDTSVEFWILPSDFGRSRSILNSNVRFRSRSSDFGRCRVFDLISSDYFMTVGYFSFCGNPLLKWAVLCRISNLGRNHWLRLLAYKIT